MGSKHIPFYVVGAVLVAGGAFWYFASRAPQAAPVPLTEDAKAYVRYLKLDRVEMKAADSYMQQTVTEITGDLTNAGPRAVDSVELFCSFYNSYGEMVLRDRVPILRPRTGGLKPGQTRPFRLPFDDIPQSWNNQAPRLVIASIIFGE